MKKFVIMLLNAVMVCSLVACGKTVKQTTDVNADLTDATIVNDNNVDITNIGIPEHIITDKETGEIINDWVPAAGKTGIYIDNIKDIDADNVKDILNAVEIADKNGYTAYNLLGSKTIKNGIVYAFLADDKETLQQYIITVEVCGENTCVNIFNGNINDIVY